MIKKDHEILNNLNIFHSNHEYFRLNWKVNFLNRSFPNDYSIEIHQFYFIVSIIVSAFCSLQVTHFLLNNFLMVSLYFHLSYNFTIKVMEYFYHLFFIFLLVYFTQKLYFLILCHHLFNYFSNLYYRIMIIFFGFYLYFVFFN